ncbi:hypothetical protein BDA96_09G183500, partial [Sorghum bicolor]
MHPAFFLLVHLLYSMHAPACSATTDCISAGEALIGDAKLVSSNGRYALGFFHPGSKSSIRHTPKHWYLGIWFYKVSQLTPIWVANRESPVIGHQRMTKLAIFEDGNLAIFNQATKSVVWSTHASIMAKNSTAVLLDNGNLVSKDATNSSNILWQSFDYPTDIVSPGAKFGIDKTTGLNRRVVSKRSMIDPSPGRYCQELDPTSAPQFVFKLCNTSIVYWSTGEWNDQYLNAMPEMSGRTLFNYKFINNNKEEYFQSILLEKDLISISILDISSQNKLLIWLEDKQEWTTIYTQPKDLCGIYATCGPFTICNSNAPLPCDYMRGFSVSGDGCSLWYDDLLNIRSYTNGTTDDGGILYLRIAAKDAYNWRNILSMLSAFFMWMTLRERSFSISNDVQGANGIIAFRYIDLQNATKKFSGRIGSGGFGSVFKGLLTDSTTIAVKRLDGVRQGEKQFRAEVTIGFCCERDRRLLVYEHMPNCSLEAHIFGSHTAVLNWSTRYQIALGEGNLAGYLAPEWMGGVAITSKVDVYSYGMLLIDIILGRRNTCKGNTSGDVHVACFPVEVASKLLNGDIGSLLDVQLSDRPTIGEVVQILKGLLEIDIPPMPRFFQAIIG